jgi:hypothetical protein
MRKLYYYVGPETIRRRAAISPPGTRITLAWDLVDWLKQSGLGVHASDLVPLTFVIDEQGALRVADRASEHVACAGGGPVLSAGEMFIVLREAGPEVVEVSNQSTGFCPEPESWLAVQEALDRLGIPHPVRFTLEVVFRRCPRCGERSVVKEGWYVCGLCGAELPSEWNF